MCRRQYFSSVTDRLAVVAVFESHHFRALSQSQRNPIVPTCTPH